MIKAGDNVRVTNWGRSYSGYYDLFEEHNIPIEYAARFAYEDSSNFERFSTYADDRRVFYVLKVVVDKDNEHDEIALITLQNESLGKIYLVNSEALELVIPKDGRTMTISEIEKELGYKVKIISEKDTKSDNTWKF